MSSSGGTWRRINVMLAVVAVVAVLAAGWAVVRLHSSGGGLFGSTDVAAARDQALDAAEKLSVVLQSVDPDKPEESMKAWQAASTGPLLTKLQADSDKYLADLRKTPSISQANAVETALTALDADAGTATAITALDVQQSAVVRGVPGPATQRQLRVKLTLNRTDQGWKVSSSGLVTA